MTLGELFQAISDRVGRSAMSFDIGCFIHGTFTPMQHVEVDRETNRVTLSPERFKYVCTRPAKNGRTAVFARVNIESEWVQIESIITEAQCEGYLQDMEAEDEERAEAIAGNIGEDWRDDAPVTPPQK